MVLVLGTLPARRLRAEPIDADILLRGGTLHDGGGGAPVAGDLAIKGDRIVAVGKFETGKVGFEVDCRGLVVAPGFIDLHNHSDGQVVDRLTRANVNFLMQGCTTVVTGNCGSGPIEVAAYYEKIDAAGAGTNVAHLVPQGNLREAVIGNAQRAATADEIAKMQELARRGMRDGAWGMSTGLIYVPSSFADTAELIEIAKVVGEEGGLYASHIRNEGTELLAAVKEALDIGRAAKLPVHISHFKSTGRDAWGLVHRAVEQIEVARKSGQTVTADQYPYIASSTSLEATVIPAWARAGGHKALLARFDDPGQSPRLRSEIAEAVHRCDDGERIKIARYAPAPRWAGLTIAAIARQESIEPVELVAQITRGGGAAIVNFSMHEDDVRYVMTVPWVATASDGRAYLPGGDRPHPRSYGTFSRKIGYYALREKTIDLAVAIRSSTGLPADILHIPNRGYLRVDHFADVVVFDPRTFADEATFDDPHRYSRGLAHVFVNGQPAVWNGAAVGTLAGRALKKEARK
ncbi:MAG: amidohydrolase family protein [Planctomycetia bacterium]|nr:amidohydrolase family protein [Planctomycetia bacterium]